MIATNQKEREKQRKKIRKFQCRKNTTRKIIKDNLSKMAIPSLMFPFYIDYFNFKMSIYNRKKEKSYSNAI